MKENCSCGFIIAEMKRGFPTNWLLCHPTNSGNRWDVPKGNAEHGESHLAAAKRELFEETGLILEDDFGIVDLGQHPYQDHRDLHLYYMTIVKIDTTIMHCSSMVENKKGPDFPEMDAFELFNIRKVSSKVSPRLDNWIKTYVPKELLVDYL